MVDGSRTGGDSSSGGEAIPPSSEMIQELLFQEIIREPEPSLEGSVEELLPLAQWAVDVFQNLWRQVWQGDSFGPPQEEGKDLLVEGPEERQSLRREIDRLLGLVSGGLEAQS
jgi:hypothetical protein